MVLRLARWWVDPTPLPATVIGKRPAVARLTCVDRRAVGSRAAGRTQGKPGWARNGTGPRW